MRVLAVLALLLLSVGPVLATDDDMALRLDAARKVITIQETDDALAATADALWPEILASLKTSGVNPDDAAIAMLKQEWFAAYKKVAASLIDGRAQAYAAAFTLDDLKAMLQFFSSPVGVKMLAKEPEVIKAFEPAERQAFRDQLRAITKRLLHDYLAAQPPVGPAA